MTGSGTHSILTGIMGQIEHTKVQERRSIIAPQLPEEQVVAKTENV